MSPGRPTAAVDLGGGLTVPTPVLVASGCFSPEIGPLADVRKFGGIVTRSVTLLPRKGIATPRMAETPSGLLWQTGLQNPGIEAFLADELPVLVGARVPVVVSLAGSTVEELMRLAMAVQETGGPAAIEVNACFPSRHREDRLFAATPEGAAEAVGAVGRLTRLPVFAKLTAATADIVEVARACLGAGAAGLTLVHSLPGMALDAETFRPELSSGEGFLSGPATRPVTVQAVARVARVFPEVPILGVGGVTSAEDAVEVLLAGAWAVQVGTAMFANPAAPIEIAQGILRFLRRGGLSSPADLRSRALLPPLQQGPEVPQGVT